MTFRIFTNDRGMEKGVPMYSCLTAVGTGGGLVIDAVTALEFANERFSQLGESAGFAPLKAIEWPPTSEASKAWLAKHVG